PGEGSHPVIRPFKSQLFQIEMMLFNTASILIIRNCPLHLPAITTSPAKIGAFSKLELFLLY
ncbi:MAG: hypothetical protein KGM99_18740, partial [Burkholderiales bacterium]|nr:hypothetical protein [Burkholderiales bacterium]